MRGKGEGCGATNRPDERISARSRNFEANIKRATSSPILGVSVVLLPAAVRMVALLETAIY